MDAILTSLLGGGVGGLIIIGIVLFCRSIDHRRFLCKCLPGSGEVSFEVDDTTVELLEGRRASVSSVPKDH